VLEEPQWDVLWYGIYWLSWHHAIVRRLCCDDNSSIRADCQWSNAEYLTNNNTNILPQVPKRVGKFKGKLQPRPDRGKLPAHVPEPLFVADSNHHRKGLTGELIKLDKEKKVHVKLTMTRMDSTRIGKDFAYMARTLKERHLARSLPMQQRQFLNTTATTMNTAAIGVRGSTRRKTKEEGSSSTTGTSRKMLIFTIYCR
jgi:hypothetical protein